MILPILSARAWPPGEHRPGCALPEAVSRPGYVFLGWYDAAGGGERLEEISAERAGDLTLYARYELLPSPTPMPSAEPELAGSGEKSELRSPHPLLLVALAAAVLLLTALYLILRAAKRRRDILD